MEQGEKLAFEDLLKNYIISDDHPPNEEENNCYYTISNTYPDQSLVTNLENLNLIINEKNQILLELKSYIKLQKDNHEKELNQKNLEINDFVLNTRALEEKVKILTSKNTFEVINYYEHQIKKIFLEYTNASNIFKHHIELIDSSFMTHCSGTQKQISSLKNTIVSLIKKNEQLTEQLEVLNRIDRMSYVYKNLLNKFAGQIEKNKKNYDQISKTHNVYVKNLEDENKHLRENLEEEKTKIAAKSVSEIDRLEKLSENLKLMSERKHNSSDLNSDSSQLFSISTIPSSTPNVSSSRFSKIVTSSKIILNHKILKLKEINEYILHKLESNQNRNSAHFSGTKLQIKKLVMDMSELIETLAKEVIHLNNQSQSMCTMNMVLQKMLKEIFSNYETFKNTSNYVEFDETIKKISRIFYNKFNIKI